MKLKLLMILIGVVELLLSKHIIVSDEKQEECTDDASTNQYGDEIGAQCCSLDGTISYRQCLHGMYFERYNECLIGVNYSVAKTTCQTNGDRLCTAQEVRSNNVVDGKRGCWHNAIHVWTSDDCGACIGEAKCLDKPDFNISELIFNDTSSSSLNTVIVRIFLAMQWFFWLLFFFFFYRKFIKKKSNM